MQDGTKINSKNLLLLDDYIKSKSENLKEKEISILFEQKKPKKFYDTSAEESNYKYHAENKIRKEFLEFSNYLEKNQIPSNTIKGVSTPYFETLKIIENSKIINNQIEIFEFYLNFNEKEFQKLDKKLNSLSDFNKKMNEFNSLYKKNSEIFLKELNSLKFGKIKILNIIEETKIFNTNLLKGKYLEFSKSLLAFDEKLRALEKKFKNFEENFNKKFKNLKIKNYSNELDDFIKTQFEYFIGNFKMQIIEDDLNEEKEKENYNSFSSPKNNLFKDLLQSFEKFFGSFKRESELKDEIMGLYKMQVNIFLIF